MNRSSPERRETSSADLLAHLRLLRRSLARWRGLAILSVGLAVFALTLAGRGSLSISEGDDFPIDPGEQVAVVRLNGLIISSGYRDNVMRSLVDSGTEVKALVVLVNSPGGAIGASERLLDQMDRFRSTERPVVFIMRDVAASGAYIAAMGSDRIFALENTITGSVGAIAQWYQVSELLSEYGVRARRVASGQLKGGVDPTAPTNEQRVAAVQLMVDQIRDWFLQLVRERRDLNEATTEFLSDGRVVRGAEGVELGLIDEIGDEQDVRSWLAAQHDIPEDTRWKYYPLTPPELGGGWWGMVRTAIKALGLPPVAEYGSLMVNAGGFWSVWEGGLVAH